jgi:homoserine O-acetyltransferase
MILLRQVKSEDLMRRIVLIVMLAAAVSASRAADYPPPTEADYVIRDFQFRSGHTIPELRMHYRTFGAPRRDDNGVVRNAVLVMHGTTGSGKQFMRDEFAGELLGKGQPLDAEGYYVILVDALGHGQSSKPSDGLRARFPPYGYLDMIEADYRLLTEGLKVNHLRLVMGTSMGGMHTWVWGETHPDFMDALMPLACLPERISGRNRVWRRMVADMIRTDPQWNNGEYASQPHGLALAAEMLFYLSSNSTRRYKEAPTATEADKLVDAFVANSIKTMDANDVLYAVEASRDYDPGPGLESIRAQVSAVNFADDLINPPELGILERQIQRVKRGKAVVMPQSDKTNGHGTHTLAAVWKEYLVELLRDTDPARRTKPGAE